MKRTSRIQTVITPLHRKKLDQLTKRSGTMNEVIERGIEILEEMEMESNIIESEEEILELRRRSELFDALLGFSGFVLVRSSTIDDLFDILIEGQSINEFIKKQRNWVSEDIEIQKTVTRLAQNYSETFTSLVEIIQLISDTFRSFYVSTSSESERKVVIHTNSFHKFPELIAAQLQGVLEYLGFRTIYNIVEDRILIEWRESSDQNIEDKSNLIIDLDAKYGLYAGLGGDLPKGSKSEKEILKEIIEISSKLEIFRWNKGILTTGNQRYTYLPQEFLIDLINEFAIHDSKKVSQLFHQIGTKVLSINFPKNKVPENITILSQLLEFVKSIFNDYFGWGQFSITNASDQESEVAISSPIISTIYLQDFMNGILSHTGFRAVTKNNIEEGHYRSEWLIKKSKVKILIVDDEPRILNSLAKTLERGDEILMISFKTSFSDFDPWGNFAPNPAYKPYFASKSMAKSELFIGIRSESFNHSIKIRSSMML